MKKIYAFFVLISVLMTSLAFSVFADTEQEINVVQTVESEDGTTVTYFDDGSFLTVYPVKTKERTSATYATTKTITGDKISTFTNASGELEWKYTLSATFSYVAGSSVNCTSASYDEEIYNTQWSFSNGAATKSGDTAIGTGKFTCKILFITVKTSNVNISIVCDTYGNLA